MLKLFTFNELDILILNLKVLLNIMKINPPKKLILYDNDEDDGE